MDFDGAGTGSTRDGLFAGASFRNSTCSTLGRAGATTFPVGTLTINLIGSLVLGFVLRYATGSTVISPEVRGALTIGFCGAFTTMSTFSYETMTLLRDSQYWYAGLYMGGTMLGCLAAVIVGAALANRLL